MVGRDKLVSDAVPVKRHLSVEEICSSLEKPQTLLAAVVDSGVLLVISLSLADAELALSERW